MGTLSRAVRGRRPWTGILILVLAASGGLLSASPAAAHGGGETEEGYLLVQQALGHLAHDTSASGIDLAMEKVDDTLATKDQEGVNVAEVKQAKAALEAGQAEQGRVLLQHSITQAMASLMPATGEMTGTKTIPSAQEGRGPLGAAGWLTLGVSLLLLLLGVIVAWFFRPDDTVRELRRSLDPSAPVLTPALSGTPPKDAS